MAVQGVSVSRVCLCGCAGCFGVAVEDEKYSSYTVQVASTTLPTTATRVQVCTGVTCAPKAGSVTSCTPTTTPARSIRGEYVTSYE